MVGYIWRRLGWLAVVAAGGLIVYALGGEELLRLWFAAT